MAPKWVPLLGPILEPPKYVPPLLGDLFCGASCFTKNGPIFGAALSRFAWGLFWLQKWIQNHFWVHVDFDFCVLEFVCDSFQGRVVRSHCGNLSCVILGGVYCVTLKVVACDSV